jgi:hypothetical protein
VRRCGSRLRVTAQLINAADDAHLWSERYDREMTDIFAIQDEISATIDPILILFITYWKTIETRELVCSNPSCAALLKKINL